MVRYLHSLIKTMQRTYQDNSVQRYVSGVFEGNKCPAIFMPSIPRLDWLKSLPLARDGTDTANARTIPTTMTHTMPCNSHAKSRGAYLGSVLVQSLHNNAVFMPTTPLCKFRAMEKGGYGGNEVICISRYPIKTPHCFYIRTPTTQTARLSYMPILRSVQPLQSRST